MVVPRIPVQPGRVKVGGSRVGTTDPPIPDGSNQVVVAVVT